MSGAVGGRDQVLGALRRALKRDGPDPATRTELQGRLDMHPRGPVPARAALPKSRQVALFIDWVETLSGSVRRVDASGEVPAAVADYLKAHNLPPQLRLAPDPEIEGLPWDAQPLLEVSSGAARESDATSVTAAFAGIAETGTLMLLSGPRGPSGLNFLPETHIVVLRASRMVGAYEEAWDRLREACGAGAMPRTVNLVTGPSRTADIEQTIQLGAHGPKRLHVVLVDDDPAARPAPTSGAGAPAA